MLYFTANKLFKMQKIKLSKGVVTQNGNYVSYKTGIINNDIPLFQKLADELKTFLDTKNILYTYPFEAHHGSPFKARSGCITIRICASSLNVEFLPFESDSIN